MIAHLRKCGISPPRPPLALPAALGRAGLSIRGLRRVWPRILGTAARCSESSSPSSSSSSSVRLPRTPQAQREVLLPSGRDLSASVVKRRYGATIDDEDDDEDE